MFNSLANWAEDKTAKVHMGRYVRFLEMQPKSPDAIARLEEVENEIIDIFIRGGPKNSDRVLSYFL